MGQLLSFLQVLQTNICAREFGWNGLVLNNLCLLSVSVSPPIFWNVFRPGRCFWRAVGRRVTINKTLLSCVLCLWITLLGCFSALISAHSLHFPRRKGLVIWPDLERDYYLFSLGLSSSQPGQWPLAAQPSVGITENADSYIPPTSSELGFLWTLPRNLHCYSTSQVILMHSKV